jgi:hypothetical protein
LTDAELDFLDGFMQAHAFGGMSVYRDLLPPGCADVIHARFGPAVAQTHLPAEGTAEFIRFPVPGVTP